MAALNYATQYQRELEQAFPYVLYFGARVVVRHDDGLLLAAELADGLFQFFVVHCCFVFYGPNGAD